jgi:hypothetical protein
MKTATELAMESAPTRGEALAAKLEHALHLAWSQQRDGEGHAYNKAAWQELAEVVYEVRDTLRKASLPQRERSE